MNRNETIVLGAMRDDYTRAGKPLPVKRQWYVLRGRIFAVPTYLGELAVANGPFTHREAHLLAASEDRYVG